MSIFGQIEAVAAGIFVAEKRAILIPFEQIPESVQFNDRGTKAHFAVSMERRDVAAFEKLIKELRA